MKTTKEIINDELGVILNSIDYDVNHALFEINKNKKWFSEEELRIKLLDMYRFMCNEYGKANIWEMNTDELLDNVDLLIEKKLFNTSNSKEQAGEER